MKMKGTPMLNIYEQQLNNPMSENIDENIMIYKII